MIRFRILPPVYCLSVVMLSGLTGCWHGPDMQIPLGKSDGNTCFSESFIDLFMQETGNLIEIINIEYPGTQLEIKRALPEFFKEHLGFRHP